MVVDTTTQFFITINGPISLSIKMTRTRHIVPRITTISGIVHNRQIAKFCNMMNETKLKVSILFYRSFQNTSPCALLRVKYPSLLKAASSNTDPAAQSHCCSHPTKQRDNLESDKTKN